MPTMPCPKKGNPKPLKAKPVTAQPKNVTGPAIPIAPPTVGRGGIGKGGKRPSVKKKAF